MKRIFEIIISLFALILLSPLFLIIAAAIIMCDGRPAIFRQKRVGKGGTDFILNKFRTMRNTKDSSGSTFDAGDRSRVTQIGSFLRKTKLDELPQLWNVLTGSMSIVGPRPEVRIWVDAYPDRWAKVLAVKPGITDPASIQYRDEEDLLAQSDNPDACYRDHILPHKLDFYEDYVKTRSFGGDIYLILKTIKAVCSPKRYSSRHD